MNYNLITDVMRLVESFELANQPGLYTADISGFRQWLADAYPVGMVIPNRTGRVRKKGAVPKAPSVRCWCI